MEGWLTGEIIKLVIQSLSWSSDSVDRRFVGMAKPDDLQKFITRAVTGQGERLLSKDLSDRQLVELSSKLASLAGTP